MALLSGLLNALAAVVSLAAIGRAVVKLLENPEKPHRELVPAWERRAATAVGVPLMLVGASTLVDGPLAVPYNPMTFLLPGIVLFLYPDFAPSPVA